MMVLKYADVFYHRSVLATLLITMLTGAGGCFFAVLILHSFHNFQCQLLVVSSDLQRWGRAIKPDD